VVFDHLTYSVLQPVRDSVYHWFDPGQYGVFVFFLVSGYIVPASLERRGSVRGIHAAPGEAGGGPARRQVRPGRASVATAAPRPRDGRA
jgi:hypothetical protein